MQKQMKLYYDEIEVGTLVDYVGDMGREYAKLILSPDSNSNQTDLKNRLLRWISICEKLKHFEYEKTEEEYDVDPEVDKLWEERSQLPKFEDHECWRIFYPDSGKMEKIDFAEISGGYAFWSIVFSDSKIDKSTSSFIKKYDNPYIPGFILFVIIVIVYVLAAKST